jgi:tocopherol cyclase
MHSILHPNTYLLHLGHHVHRGIFFEGWYYNMVLSNDSRTIAVIPGVLMNDDGRHSFLIVAYGNTSHYFRFPFEAFRSSSITEEFRVNISRENTDKNRMNIFSANEIIVDVQPNKEDDATESIQMNITVSSNTIPKDLSWLMPGTMGPFSWVSLMQCYHHVLSMRHNIHGTIQFGQHPRTNITGSGYLEKDWGQSFPSTWIWGQANQWMSTSPISASLFFSFAIVPVGFGLELPGFLVIFEHNNQFFRFNTYLLSIVHDLVLNNNTNRLSFTVYDLFFEYKLSVSIQFEDANSGALLYAPRKGRMEKFVKEMLDNNAHFDVRLSKLIPQSDDLFVQRRYQEHVLFDARAQHVALEMHGDIIWLNEQFYNMYRKTYSWCFSLIRILIQYYRFVLLLTTTILVIVITLKFIRISLT